MEIDTELRYVLQTPFPYAHSGEEVEASFITLSAPTSRNRKQCAWLKQAFMRALPKVDAADAADVDNSKEGETPSGDEVMMMIAMSPVVDLGEVLETAAELFTKGKVAQVEGEENLTKPLLELMSNEDLEVMTGNYLVGFILRSSLEKMNKL